ncbi:MAG TPA: hypothetical protein VIK73_03490 [Limnochordales bacterium]
MGIRVPVRVTKDASSLAWRGLAGLGLLWALAVTGPCPVAIAQELSLPAYEVPIGALAVADYWAIGEVSLEEEAGRAVSVRLLRLQVEGEMPRFSVELRLPPAAPGGFEAVALVPESELDRLAQALARMVQPPRRAEVDGRDEVTMLYSPVPDLIVIFSRRPDGAQRAELYIQGESALLRGDRGLTQLRDLLARAQGRIRDLRQRS